ncbi:type I 3-dehydroquinate dehydratase [Neobacillus sp. MM2021_6]|uniref:type I 3-dehydroquinate dehydratase n=1 Tax=Bacillaceae TaxID=186817 RepID=UPI0014091E4F|nr:MULTISPECIES: type I 3-dehydroquinate dehydratase [Bacillaceae]MBO0961915.1 type I 3-dehydroquinate dehydratase [Neobacillus sp. MM2021_6]NHC20390.1 type I 3-dehydroquinate dehydratase [Bacillus sp. MM2020_4]
MKKTVTVRGITIGEGAPKICVSLIGRTKTELIEEAAFLKTVDLDIVEWRADFFNHVESMINVKEALGEIRAILADMPLIFTFRSKKEGGEKEISNKYYIELNKAMAESGMVDIIDIELFNEEIEVKDLINTAHANDVFVILSNHDFIKTPSREEIVERLRKAQEWGGDLPKIAVMPANSSDVLTLLEATNTMNENYADRPFITISMGTRGIISRLAGGSFGSAITFGASGKGSAPGQIGVNELRNILNLLQ